MSHLPAVVASLVALSALAAPTPAVAEDAPHFTARNGSSECWGKGKTLWHFIVFNDGSKVGRYTVQYRWSEDGATKSYSQRVPKNQGINDGIVIPRGKTIDHILVTAAQGTVFLRSDVSGSPRCERR